MQKDAELCQHYGRWTFFYFLSCFIFIRMMQRPVELHARFGDFSLVSSSGIWRLTGMSKHWVVNAIIFIWALHSINEIKIACVVAWRKAASQHMLPLQAKQVLLLSGKFRKKLLYIRFIGTLNAWFRVVALIKLEGIPECIPPPAVLQ